MGSSGPASRVSHNFADLTHLKHLVGRLRWLEQLDAGPTAFAPIPPAKVRHFAAEARSLDAARVQEVRPAKRHTLSAALVRAEALASSMAAFSASCTQVGEERAVSRMPVQTLLASIGRNFGEKMCRM